MRQCLTPLFTFLLYLVLILSDGVLVGWFAQFIASRPQKGGGFKLSSDDIFHRVFTMIRSTLLVFSTFAVPYVYACGCTNMVFAVTEQ